MRERSVLDLHRRSLLKSFAAVAAVSALPLAVPYGALPEVARTLSGSISGKIVIDTCNPFPDRDREIANRAREKGAGLMTAELLPRARVIRAFNLIAATMYLETGRARGKVAINVD